MQTVATPEEIAAVEDRVHALGYTTGKMIGEQVYTKNCVTCHQADGKGLPPVFPALAGSKIATGDRAAHIRRVYQGVAGTAMQAFGTQLNAAEIAAVVHYERHSFGNKSDDVTQPVDVLNLVSAQ